MCFGCSKEPSYRDGSFEYQQHTFWLRNKKNNFQLRTLTGGLMIPKLKSINVLLYDFSTENETFFLSLL